MSDLQVSLVAGKPDLVQISTLNETYLKTRLSQGEREQEGFLTWRYDLPLLERLHQLAPSVICKEQEQVVGYALTALREATDVHPEQELLIPQISGLVFQGRSLSSYTYYLMGQLCVAKSYRGRGVVEKMYAFHRQVYSPKYELIVTTISLENVRSERVHQRVGWKPIHLFADHFGSWRVWVWDWTSPGPSVS